MAKFYVWLTHMAITLPHPMGEEVYFNSAAGKLRRGCVVAYGQTKGRGDQVLTQAIQEPHTSGTRKVGISISHLPKNWIEA